MRGLPIVWGDFTPLNGASARVEPLDLLTLTSQLGRGFNSQNLYTYFMFLTVYCSFNYSL